VLQLDALCLCLKCEAMDRPPAERPATAYAAAGEWLLSVAAELLRPDLPADDEPGSDGPDPPRAAAAAGGRARAGRRPPFERRFRYFVGRVSKARLWSDDGGVLFRRLQAAAEELMGGIAVLCHARYEELRAEAEGAALVALPSYPERAEGTEGGEAWDRRLRQDSNEVSRGAAGGGRARGSRPFGAGGSMACAC
jgi:hypothetical protein